jgi:hypothetical protein
MERVRRKWDEAKRTVMALLRELADEAAYERHCQRMVSAGRVPVSPGEFYAQLVRRKYAGVRRCC